MAARNGYDKQLTARFEKLNVAAKPPSGLASNGKPTAKALQPLYPRQLVPRPPLAKKKPNPPTCPKKPTSTYFRKFYALKTEEHSEQRISGDGEAVVDDEVENSGDNSETPSFERLPPDGCFSDIAEEEDYSDGKVDDFDDGEDDILKEFENNFYDDEMDEMEADEGI